MKNQLFRFLSDQRRYWPWLLLFAGVATSAGLIQMGLANLSGGMVDAGMAGDFQAIYLMALLLVALLALELFRSYINCVINANATERMFLDVRMTLVRRLMRADTGAFERKFRSGDMLSRVNGDVINLCEMLAGRFTWLFRVTVTAFGARGRPWKERGHSLEPMAPRERRRKDVW